MGAVGNLYFLTVRDSLQMWKAYLKVHRLIFL